MNYPRMGISMISMLGISIYIPTERLVLSPLLINQTRIEATSFRASRESGECHQHVSWSPNGRHREQSLNINESTGEMENFEDFGWFWSVQHWSLWFNLQSGFLIFFGRVLKSFNWLRGREGGRRRGAKYIKVLRNVKLIVTGRTFWLSKSFLAAVCSMPFCAFKYFVVLASQKGSPHIAIQLMPAIKNALVNWLL